MSRKNKNGPFSLRYLVFDIIKITAALPGLIWFRPKWIYESREAKKKVRGGALVVSNHNGIFDPIYLMFAVWYRRHHFICTKELYESRARPLFRAFMCIPIDRANFGIDSMRTITDELKRGSLVSIFPEGKINVGTDAVSAFKSGMVLMALRGNAPIVPVYIKKKKHFWSRLTFVIGEKTDVSAAYGERPTLPQIEEISEEVRKKEERLAAL